VKRKKDWSSLLHKGKIVLPYFKGHYCNVYIWATQEALEKNISQDNGGWSAKVSGRNGGCIACHAPNTYRIDLNTDLPVASPLLSEFHFVWQKWSAEIVSHEISHFQTHLIRLFADDHFFEDMEQEERIAYQIGELTQALAYWIDTVDPYHDRPDA
jgi:hypothetical protein